MPVRSAHELKPWCCALLFGFLLLQTNLCVASNSKLYIDKNKPNSVLQRAEKLRSLGHITAATILIQQYIKKHNSTLPKRQSALLHGQLATLFTQAGKVDFAKQAFFKSISLAKEANATNIHAYSLLNRGSLFAQQKRYISALRDFEACLKLTSSEFQVLHFKAKLNLARVLILGGNLSVGEKVLEKMSQRFSQQPVSSDTADALINLAVSYQMLADKLNLQQQHENAKKLLLKAKIIAQKINNNYLLSYSLGHLAKSEEKLGHSKQALDLYQQAIFTAQQLEAPELLFNWEWKKGRLQKILNNTTAAIDSYRLAVYHLKQVREDLLLAQSIGSSSFRDIIGPVYFELADLLLKGNASNKDAALAQQILTEARFTIESLKTAELQDFFQDDCVTNLQSKTAGVETIGDRTAVLYPILLKDRTELLISTEKGISQFTINATTADIASTVRQFRQRLEDFSNHQYLPHAQQLYEWLIRPAEATLRANNIDTLVLVPDGPLRTIPFAALHDGENFLAKQYSVAVTPGLTLTDPRPLPRTDMQLLLSGLTESVQGFTALPNVEEEIKQVAALYSGQVLKNKDYQTPTLQTALKNTPYRIIHIASHGQFKSDPNETFLLTYDGKLSMDSLEGLLQLSKYRNESVELLTLSACQTAAGDDRAALGLAGIAVKAGARSVLATLWFINDRSTSALITDFYNQLKDNQNSKAQALQQAQIKMIQSTEYNHPGYWAPFLMIGNWL